MTAPENLFIALAESDIFEGQPAKKAVLSQIAFLTVTNLEKQGPQKDWSYLGWCWASQEYLASRCGCGVRIVKVAIKQATADGIVRVRSYTAKNGARRNEYQLVGEALTRRRKNGEVARTTRRGGARTRGARTAPGATIAPSSPSANNAPSHVQSLREAGATTARTHVQRMTEPGAATAPKDVLSLVSVSTKRVEYVEGSAEPAPPRPSPSSHTPKPNTKSGGHDSSQEIRISAADTLQRILGTAVAILKELRLPVTISKDQKEQLVALAEIAGIEGLKTALGSWLYDHRPTKEDYVLDEFLAGPGAEIVMRLKPFYDQGARGDWLYYLLKPIFTSKQMSPAVNDFLASAYEKLDSDIVEELIKKANRTSKYDATPEDYLKSLEQAYPDALAAQRASDAEIEDWRKKNASKPVEAVAPEPATSPTTDTWDNVEVERTYA